MKTPKEKADELIEVFHAKILAKVWKAGSRENQIDSVKTSEKAGLSCAIFCVEQIIQSVPTEPYEGQDWAIIGMPAAKANEYWRDVLRELVERG